MPQEKGDQFRGRTSSYSESRPGYPDGIVQTLIGEKTIGSKSLIADVGSGTGKLAELFLKHGFNVVCIEPNPEMRARAEEDLREYRGLDIRNGTAENTGLDPDSVDLIAAGQAFHWFDPTATVVEFSRILKPGGQVALIWNDRIKEEGSFNEAYEHICVNYSKGYHKSGSLSLNRTVIKRFFSDDPKVFTYENKQEMDLNGVKGRYFSASYALGQDDSKYNDLIREMKTAFSEHSRHGLVSLKYETKMFLGTLSHKS